MFWKNEGKTVMHTKNQQKMEIKSMHLMTVNVCVSVSVCIYMRMKCLNDCKIIVYSSGNILGKITDMEDFKFGLYARGQIYIKYFISC